MLPDAYQLAQTKARFDATSAERMRNERLISQGRVLQVDTPDRIQKFLARRGIVRSAVGYELTGESQPAGDELASDGTGEVLERIHRNQRPHGGRLSRAWIANLEECGPGLGRRERRGGGPPYGTGFLVSPRLLLTNHHVLGDPTPSPRNPWRSSTTRCRRAGSPIRPPPSKLDVETFHLADRHLDFALVALSFDLAGRPVAVGVRLEQARCRKRARRLPRNTPTSSSIRTRS